MSEKKIKTRIQQKHDTAANWYAAGTGSNPFVPMIGELIVYDGESGALPRFKIGDGVTKVHELPFQEDNKLEAFLDATYSTAVNPALQFTLRDDKKSYALTGYDLENAEEVSELIIPAFYNGLPVTEIASGVIPVIVSHEYFWYEEYGEYDWVITPKFAKLQAIKKLVIPDTVSYIQSNAFAGLSMCESEQGIGSFTSWGALEELIIPFVGTSVDATKSNSYLGAIFYNEYWGSSAPGVNDSGLQTWWDSDYYEQTGSDYCVALWVPSSLRVVRISDKATQLGCFAFDWDSNIQTIYLGSSIKTAISQYSFQGCSNLTNLFVNNPKELLNCDALLNRHSNLNIHYSYTSDTRIKTIEDKLKTVASPMNFVGCGGTLPDPSVSKKGDVFAITSEDDAGKEFVFDGTSWIELGYVRTGAEPDGLTFTYDIDRGTYSVAKYTGNDTSLIIPYSYRSSPVAAIADRAFYQCTTLNSVELPDSITSIGDYLFYGCTSLEHVNLPKNITTLTARTFRGCSILASINIPDTVTTIDSYAFYGCTALGSLSTNPVILPPQLKVIGSYAFNNCVSLSPETYVFPDTLQTIGTGAFKGAANPDNSPIKVYIPDSVTDISASAFSEVLFEEIELGSGVTKLPNNIFKSCTNLKKVYIKATECSIVNKSAFADCTALTDVYFAGPAGSLTIPADTFAGSVTIHYNYNSDLPIKSGEGPDSLQSTTCNALGAYSHAEGYTTTASAYGSHAEGGNTSAIADYAHSEGQDTTASGTASHAEGNYNTTNASDSHVEGISNTIYSDASGAHAEGIGQGVYGRYSHAEGGDNVVTADGTYAHVEGIFNTVAHSGAHVGGFGNTSYAKYQTVIGTGSASNSDALFIVGNGEIDDGMYQVTSQSNAFTVNKDGTATLGNATPENDYDVTSKIYVEEKLYNKADYTGTSIKAASGTRYIKICTVPIPVGNNDVYFEFDMAGRSGNKFQKVKCAVFKQNSATDYVSVYVSGNWGNAYEVCAYKYTSGSYVELWGKIPSWDCLNILKKSYVDNTGNTYEQYVNWNYTVASALPTESSTVVKVAASLEKWAGKAAAATVADSATKLATPRTIEFSGAFEATKSFDGSSSLGYQIGSVREAYLSWGGRDITGSISPIDAAASGLHSANRFQFAKPAGITIEYSRDGGSSWTDYGASDSGKVNLVSGNGTTYYIGGRSSGTTVNDKLRVTLDATAMGVYTQLRKLLLNISTSYATGSNVVVEYSNKGTATTFKALKTCELAGWSGWNSISFSAPYFGGSDNQTNNYAKIRLTFGITGINTAQTTNALTIMDIVAIGDTYWATPSNMAKTGHIYSWDANQNATFPGAVYATKLFANGKEVTSSSVQLITWEDND